MAVSAEEQQTPAWQIFNRHFTVTTQVKFLHSDAFLKHRGIIAARPSDAIDEMNATRQTVLTIAKIVEMRLNGAVIGFVYPNDVKEVYSIIVSHLRDWLVIVQRGFFLYLPPPEDLFILEEIAADLHPTVALMEMKRLNNDSRATQLGQTFLGNKSPNQGLTLDKARTYKHVVPMIIDRGRTYYGINEFGFKE